MAASPRWEGTEDLAWADAYSRLSPPVEAALSDEEVVRAAVPDAYKSAGGIWTNTQVWKRQSGAGWLGSDWAEARQHPAVVAYEESQRKPSASPVAPVEVEEPHPVTQAWRDTYGGPPEPQDVKPSPDLPSISLADAIEAARPVKQRCATCNEIWVKCRCDGFMPPQMTDREEDSPTTTKELHEQDVRHERDQFNTIKKLREQFNQALAERDAALQANAEMTERLNHVVYSPIVCFWCGWRTEERTPENDRYADMREHLVGCEARMNESGKQFLAYWRNKVSSLTRDLEEARKAFKDAIDSGKVEMHFVDDPKVATIREETIRKCAEIICNLPDGSGLDADGLARAEAAILSQLPSPLGSKS
jgi:hypothetical protein